MSVLQEPQSRRPVTCWYELRPPEDTRLYDFQPEDKALALAAHSATTLNQSTATDSPFEAAYKSDFDEDTYILTEPEGAANVISGRRSRGRTKPHRARRRYFGRSPLLKRPQIRLGGGRQHHAPFSTPAIIQFYNGIVDSVHRGLAYLTLEARNGHGERLQIEWDAAELSAEGIGERQPFILKTITEGNRLEYEFIPDQLHPLPADMQREISDLLSHYRATGQLDDDGE